MPQFLSLLVSVIVLVLLVAPPILALRMLALRLTNGQSGSRMPYQALAGLVLLLLLFNLLVWAGMPGFLRGLLPDLVNRNLGLFGLLLSWIAAGICVMLAVLAPHRQRSRV